MNPDTLGPSNHALMPMEEPAVPKAVAKAAPAATKSAKSKTTVSTRKPKRTARGAEKPIGNPEKVRAKGGKDGPNKGKNKEGKKPGKARYGNTEKSNSISNNNKPRKSKIERQVEAKRRQYSEAQHKADEDAKSRSLPLKRKSALQRTADALKGELEQLKKVEAMENAQKKEREEAKERKEEEKERKKEEKQKRKEEKRLGSAVSNDEDGNPKPGRTTARVAKQAMQERIRRKLEREWEDRDAEAEKRANLEKAVARAIRIRNAEQKAIEDEKILRYFEEERAREERIIQEQRKIAEKLIQENKANVTWPPPGAVLRQVPLPKQQEEYARNQLSLYTKDEFPNRLQEFLPRNQNAAEIFRKEGRSMLLERVEGLYNKLIANAQLGGDPEDNDRARYEDQWSAWHALLEQYYHATGWPDWSELDKQMQESNSFRTINARMANERIAMCNGNEDKLREIFEEIFLRIKFRKTRKRLTRRITGSEPRPGSARTPMMETDGNRAASGLQSSFRAERKQRKTYSSSQKWLKRKRKAENDDEEIVGGDDGGGNAKEEDEGEELEEEEQGGEGEQGEEEDQEGDKQGGEEEQEEEEDQEEPPKKKLKASPTPPRPGSREEQPKSKAAKMRARVKREREKKWSQKTVEVPIEIMEDETEDEGETHGGESEGGVSG